MYSYTLIKLVVLRQDLDIKWEEFCGVGTGLKTARFSVTYVNFVKD